MNEEELRFHNLTRTNHLPICPVYGDYPKDDVPCRCAELGKDWYIKRLELKIGIMRFYVPKDKEKMIDKKLNFEPSAGKEI